MGSYKFERNQGSTMYVSPLKVESQPSELQVQPYGVAAIVIGVTPQNPIYSNVGEGCGHVFPEVKEHGSDVPLEKRTEFSICPAEITIGKN